MEIKEIIDELKKFSDDLLEFHEPVDPLLILDFESKYNLVLPNDYKLLLSFTNGFSLMGSGVLGLFKEKNRYSLGVVYEIEHFQVENPQPLFLVPFHNDGRGNFYCFDTRNTALSKDFCPIIFWQHDVEYLNKEPEVVNENLADWINEVVIDWTLEDYDYNGDEK